MVSLQELSQERVYAAWQSLLMSMDYWARNTQAQGMPQHLVNLVEDARSFARRYLDFFATLPADLIQHELSDPWVIGNQAREQVMREWDTIQHALEQRMSDRFAPRLKDMDQLAAEALLPLFPSDQAKTATTYLHKIYDITRFAFSKVPLLGAPFSALHLPESWLAIPHEAGHYVYWNSTATLGEFAALYARLEQAVIDSLANSLPARDQRGYFRRSGEIYRIWLTWLNELFADMYGTLVSGPASGWSLQISLRSRLNMRDLQHIHDDADHPVPYLRPFIHIVTLRHMAELSHPGEFADHLRAAAADLERSWVKSWPEGTAYTLSTPDNWGSMEEVIARDLPPIIKALLVVPLDSTGQTLAESFRNGHFYTPDRHARIEAAVAKLRDRQAVQLDTPLEMCATVQLAIVSGADPVFVRRNFGFGEEPQPSQQDPERDKQFAYFLSNVTGQREVADQQRAWRRVVSSLLSEYAADDIWGGHHHPHMH